MAFPSKNSMIIIVAMVVSVSLMLSTIKGYPNLTVEDKRCSKASYSINDAYDGSVQYVLRLLDSTTASSPGYDLRSQSIDPNAPKAYGHGSCNIGLSSQDCVTCMVEAFLVVTGECNGKVGGRAFLTDCSIRYENYHFTDK